MLFEIQVILYEIMTLLMASVPDVRATAAGQYAVSISHSIPPVVLEQCISSARVGIHNHQPLNYSGSSK